MEARDINSTLTTVKPARYLRARYTRVTRFFATIVISVLFWDVILRRIGLRRLSRRTAERRYRNAAIRFRALATRLGGVWIKVGQFLSARLDILPETITSELAGLQDEVDPEPFEAMRKMVEEEFGISLEERFADFDPHPLASASLGQVHRARLPSGEAVVVKVQRPDIHDLIQVDLAALTRVIGWLKRYPPITRRANLDALMAEFSRTLWEEVDYLAEAENARRFGEMFRDDPKVRIPEVYGDYTTVRVLTLEDVYFTKITDYAAVEALGVELAEVAERLFHTYLWQIFVVGFFHADPHPGNLFVEPIEPDGWRLVFVDFGMVGQITPEMKQGMRDLVIAVGTRDMDRLMQSYQRLGFILPGADLERIRQAEAVLFDRVWGKSMRELVRTHPQEMRQFAKEFRDVMYEMPFQVPEDMIFLGRCVAILAGMCTGLDSEFNLFEGLQPFAEQLLSEEGGEWLNELFRILIEQARALSTLPTRMESTLEKIERGEILVTMKVTPDLEQQLKTLTRSIDRVVGAIFFAALSLIGSVLYVSGERLLGAVALGMALLLMGWVVLRGGRG
ncbi:MAG: AarF/ABC1/UbiB kinase family protein [Anaerolineaceae bacterium]|nr:MAG: AarF/ABC1/UbiB kinase family protein [Anaerolineaceae bacterium]